MLRLLKRQKVARDPQKLPDKYLYGSVSAGREKWPFNVIFLDALASLGSMLESDSVINSCF